MAIDLKKKLGPLPVWAWAGLGAAGLGLAYYLHARNSASSTTSSTSTVDPNTIDPSTGIPWSQEYEALESGQGSAGGGSSGSLDTTGLATGTTTTDQLAQQLQGIQDELATGSTNALTDGGLPTFAQEISDVTGGISALQAAGLVPITAASSATGSTPAAAAKSIAGLPILAQLEDLAAGLVTKAQLGPNAQKQLAAVNGNVQAAISARQNTLTQTGSKPVTRATTTTTTKVGQAVKNVGKKL